MTSCSSSRSSGLADRLADNEVSRIAAVKSVLQEFVPSAEGGGVAGSGIGPGVQDQSWRPANGSPGGSSRNGGSGSSGSAATSAYPNPHCASLSRPDSSNRSSPGPEGSPDAQQQGPPTPLRRCPRAALGPVASSLPGTGRHHETGRPHVPGQDRRRGLANPQGSRDPERRLARPHAGRVPFGE